MKLNVQAKHDPAHGVWCRVCRTCFESREGFRQEVGPSAIRPRGPGLTPSPRALTRALRCVVVCAVWSWARTLGTTRDLTKQFRKLRKPVQERVDLELNRLIMRLDKVGERRQGARGGRRAPGSACGLAGARERVCVGGRAHFGSQLGWHTTGCFFFQLRVIYEQAGAGQISSSTARGAFTTLQN